MISNLPPAQIRRHLLGGLAAGVAGGLLLTIVLTTLRVSAGIPLLVEVASDRLLPHLSAMEFLMVLGDFGGPMMAKQIAFGGGFAGQVALAALVGLGYGWLRARLGPRRASAILAGAVVAVTAGTLGALWPNLRASYLGLPPGSARLAAAAALFFAYCLFGLALAGLARVADPRPAPAGQGDRPLRSPGRRSLLVGGAAVVLGVIAGAQIGQLFRRGFVVYDGQTLPDPIRPVTPNDRFYVVTKNLVDPDVAVADWRLSVGGLVEQPFELTARELAGLPSVEQETTLECISNGVGYGLLSNAIWRGVPVHRILSLGGIRPQARWLTLRGADGYTHSLDLERALRPSTLVAYGMNGQPLPRLHGFPARAIVPGTYGEVSVKWLTQIELEADQVKGYYETQGWRPDFVHTMSRIDRPGRDFTASLSQQPVVMCRGTAFAGDRGIAKVELSWQPGDWQPARLAYQGSPLAWVLWTFEWRPPQPGRYTLQVRATDGQGTLQTSTVHGFVPDGATGYHMRPVTILP